MDLDIYQKREQQVVYSNRLVQRYQNTFDLPELKVLYYVISLIKPPKAGEEQPLKYSFSIQTFCKVAGISYNAGANYDRIRKALKKIRDTSWEAVLPDGRNTSISFFAYEYSSKGTGKVEVELSRDMLPMLIGLTSETTRYELLYVLGMKSKYSVKLYNLTKSWAGLGSHEYTLQDFRNLLGLKDGELERYPDLRRRCLDTACAEICEQSDLDVSYVPITEGARKVVGIRFIINKKTERDIQRIQFKINDILDEGSKLIA